MRAFALSWSLCLFACGPAALTPSGGPAFGHFEVTAEADALSTLGEPLRVAVGGVAAYDVVRVSPRVVRFTVQGHFAGGAQDVVVSARGRQVVVGPLSYARPSHPALARVVAFGASLTMGTQDATINRRTQLHGPAALVARQAGAYLGLPLLHPGYLPELQPSDFDLTTCRDTGTFFATIASRAASELLPKLKDRDGNVHIARLRVDPKLEATNVAIGGTRVTELVAHPPGLFAIVLEHLVWEPDVDTSRLISPPAQSQLDRVVALGPTLALSTDLIGNDYNNVDLAVDGVPSLDALTPEEDFTRALRVTLARLDATGAEVFLATGPDATLLPRYDEKVAALRAKGYPEAQAQGWRDELRARISRFNAILLRESAVYPRVHVVDVASRVAEVVSNGLDVGGEHLSAAPMGGLLSLDGMHFSDTGYAVLANLFIEELNAVLGTRIAPVDLVRVHAEDAYSVEALRARGFSCAGR